MLNEKGQGYLLATRSCHWILQMTDTIPSNSKTDFFKKIDKMYAKNSKHLSQVKFLSLFPKRALVIELKTALKSTKLGTVVSRCCGYIHLQNAVESSINLLWIFLP